MENIAKANKKVVRPEIGEKEDKLKYLPSNIKEGLNWVIRNYVKR